MTGATWRTSTFSFFTSTFFLLSGNDQSNLAFGMCSVKQVLYGAEYEIQEWLFRNDIIISKWVELLLLLSLPQVILRRRIALREKVDLIVCR